MKKKEMHKKKMDKEMVPPGSKRPEKMSKEKKVKMKGCAY